MSFALIFFNFIYYYFILTLFYQKISEVMEITEGEETNIGESNSSTIITYHN